MASSANENVSFQELNTSLLAPPTSSTIPPLPPLTELDRLGFENHQLKCELLSFKNQQLASQIANVKKELIQKKMVMFVDQLRQFPLLFKHLQNNPDTLAQLLQQFKWKQEKELLTPVTNNCTYSSCHNNNYTHSTYAPYAPYDTYYNNYSPAMDTSGVIATYDALPPMPTVNIEPIDLGENVIDLTDNKDEIIDITEEKIERVNVKEEYDKAMKINIIIRCRLIRRRQFIENDFGDNIFRQCESQFMRSCQRDINYNFLKGMNNTIKQVEYIINPTLIKRFECKKKELMSKYGYKTEDKLNVILAWHGTPQRNINNIVANNFNLNCLGMNCNNNGYFGKGIYFSEFARISEGYGDGLLLCKIILGKCYKMDTSRIQMGRGLQKGYDSHVVIGCNDNKYGEEIVIFDADQILPCYIVKY